MSTKIHDHMLDSSWDMAHNGWVIFHFGLFLSFYPQTAQKVKNSLKWKKFLEMSSFYKSAPKIIIPFINFIFHFGIFFTFFPLYPNKGKFQKSEKNVRRYYHFLQVYQKSWLYVRAIFLVFQKNGENARGIIISCKFTKRHGHMIYCSWDMSQDKCSCYFHFGLFLPFYHPNSTKNEN